MTDVAPRGITSTGAEAVHGRSHSRCGGARVRMRSPRLSFVDALALIAILAPETPQDRLVAQQWQLELDAGTTLVTTDYALAMASSRLQRSHGLAGLKALHEEVAPALHVEWCTRSDHERAVAALLATKGRGVDLFHGTDREVRRRLKVTSDLRWV